MVDACANPNFNSFWLFAAGATNAETTITVRDTHSWHHANDIQSRAARLFVPVANTQAFQTCAQGG